MSHIFPSSPQGEKISLLNLTCYIGNTILGRIYILPGTATFTYTCVAVPVRIISLCIHCVRSAVVQNFIKGKAHMHSIDASKDT